MAYTVAYECLSHLEMQTSVMLRNAAVLAALLLHTKVSRVQPAHASTKKVRQRAKQSEPKTETEVECKGPAENR